ncbi:hypothetical protein BKH41_07310 [Helicobacter sp. 12S02232-10]|uniref:DUF7488 domain-containing protein n=1 Tax=Helicobacter sp. 12S02232-10 TaxID=1476197 RepID=UPI000BA4EA14|nr:PDZ domain-containing protein [Helicobacter sp. 12S02232-10]PAF47689.1 hypothetical protein BKH41_07310 [Helicobacter sp. 12S02232-10]
MPNPPILKSLLIFWIVSGVFGYDFSYCVKYYDEATISQGGQHAVSIKTSKGNVSLLFSPSPPIGVKILKADPFVGLYLIETRPPKYAYHISKIDDYAKKKELSSIASKVSSKGRIIKAQSGFTHYAQFSVPVLRNGVVGNICYQIYGIGVGGKYFIDKTYLDRFLNQKSPYYGDIGVRVVQRDKYVIVRQVDPFFEHNPFLPGDVILSVNGKALNSYADFEWVVSNLPYKKPAEILLIRNNQKKKIKVLTDKRYGGFLLSDTFLERFGIWLDQNLTITRIDENPSKKLDSFRVGDKIIWIDKKPVLKESDDSFAKADDSLRSALSKAGLKKNIEVLIMRNGLEFYLKL